MAFISIHEMGHIVVSSLFGWKIEQVLVLPFGGITIFNEKINLPLKEEFWVAVSGFLFQMVFYFLVRTFTSENMVIQIHYGLLIFNLLPIYPLDGSKILNVFLNKIFPFTKSHLATIILSFLCLILFLLSKHTNLFYLCILFFLMIESIREIRKHPYLSYKFLLERHLYSFFFSKTKKITHIKQMKKDYEHVFIIKGKAHKEREILGILFDKKRDV